MTDPGLAVCLSSSFFGHYAHAGFLTGLDQHGVKPGRISGCSAGAIAGGLWSAGIRGQALEDILFSLWFKRCFFDLGSLWRFFGVVTWSYSRGVLSGSRMERFLGDLIGDLRMEECDPRIEIAVANLTRGRGEVRDHGVLRDFMIASFSMPLIYKPRRIEGEEFLDGGVSNGTPFDHWLGDPKIHTIVVHRIQHSDDEGPGNGPCGVITGCHSITWHEFFERRRREAEASGKKVIFVQTTHERPRIFHGKSARSHFQAGIETGAECAGQILSGLPASVVAGTSARLAIK
jgi:predicted acylesterase/phospholipase RssA